MNNPSAISHTPWYVLRDLARPNAKQPAYKLLQAMPELSGRLFIPMKQRVYVEFGKRVVRNVPYMTDLIFVHLSRPQLDPIVARMPLLQYRYLKGGKQFEAMTVPHAEMTQFMQAVQQAQTVLYYSLDQVSPQMYGHHIRIIGGNLDGTTGRLLTRRGSKTKRLLISLPACNLAAAIEVEPQYIQLLD